MGLLKTLNPNPLIKRYVYPMFGAQNDMELVHRMTLGILIYAVAVLLLPRAAPYGRHSNRSFGFGVPARLAWLLQESPAFIVPFLLVVTASRPAYGSITNQICLGLFIMHYFQRSFIFPFLIKSKQSVPLLPFLLAFLTCLYNGILHGVYFANFKKYDDSVWLWKPYFWTGLVVYLVGMKINISADSALRALRVDGDNSYKIPRGGMFEYVSCANYFGEIIEMWGYALCSCSPPAVAHALFTTCFLARRATQHHQWYLKKFDDYPPERKAILPFLL
uniref:3-oxo-5alpha-steroid 4-dehydrogenase (NADP(+)) n=2 Tax=Hirondellea gigas TaxID=1518452 RepID=A0A2P2HWW1_9CRUS